MNDGTVIVFARTPERGRVKTRLVPALGEAGALELYRAFLSDSLDLARRAGGTVVLARTPGAGFPELALADRVVVQRGEGFGARMDFVLRRVAADLPATEPYVILGADAPHLAPERVREALKSIQVGGPSAVVGRCQEGGFYLLGFRGPPVPVASAFESRNEASRVVRLLTAAGRPPVLLPPFFDIDTPKDLDRLAAQLAARPPAPTEDGWIPGATRACLQRLVVQNEGRELRVDAPGAPANGAPGPIGAGPNSEGP